MRVRWAVLLVPIVFGLAAAVSTQRGETDAIRMDFVRTLTMKATGESTVREQGTYWITPDGGYRRTDLVRNGVRTAEIVRFADGVRISLNLDTEEVRVGTIAGPPVRAPSGGRIGVPGPRRGWDQSSDAIVNLGTKTVDGITLSGSRQILVLGNESGQSQQHLVDMWVYPSSNPRIAPFMVEMRFDTPDSIDDRRLTSARRLAVSPEVFEVPPGFDEVR